MTVHKVHFISTLFGMPTHFKNTQRSVAHWLRTSAIGSTVLPPSPTKKTDTTSHPTLVLSLGLPLNGCGCACAHEGSASKNIYFTLFF